MIPKRGQEPNALGQDWPGRMEFSGGAGNIADLPYFNKATPMECNWPALSPSPGDYLTVVDGSPTPAVGQANYIVTAANHSADIRYGRQNIAGVLSGRNPVLLPSCP